MMRGVKKQRPWRVSKNKHQVLGSAEPIGRNSKNYVVSREVHQVIKLISFARKNPPRHHDLPVRFACRCMYCTHLCWIELRYRWFCRCIGIHRGCWYIQPAEWKCRTSKEMIQWDEISKLWSRLRYWGGFRVSATRSVFFCCGFY